MNAVGIDVSKGKSMVAIMRPFGEIVSSPFEIKHTTSDINSLVELINSEVTRMRRTVIQLHLLALRTRSIPRSKSSVNSDSKSNLHY